MSGKTIVVTGGCGFIGSCLVKHLLEQTTCTVINIDKLTYAGSLDTVASISNSKKYFFYKTDICNSVSLDKIFQTHQPDFVMHLAAESHVDRSIDGPADFIQTNIVGTYTLLEASRKYFSTLKDTEKIKGFRFHHISTDEVYGSLGTEGLFTEETSYKPNSPYSASKASSDHLVRAWHHTFDLPVLITNCSNNYGPYQFPEKLIPLIVLNAIAGKPLPVYGTGKNVRDWLYVEDHVEALVQVLNRGTVGETYNIGGYNERSNIEVVRKICLILDKLLPEAPQKPHERLISFVQDRPGHDLRYAIDATKINQALDWKPKETFETGLLKTVKWIIENKHWYAEIAEKKYSGERLGKEGTKK